MSGAREQQYSIDAIAAMTQQRCRDSGPASELWEEVSKMRDDNRERDDMLSKFIGAQSLARWLIPIVASVLSSSLAAAAVGWLIMRSGH